MLRLFLISGAVIVTGLTAAVYRIKKRDKELRKHLSGKVIFNSKEK